jgi:prepilin-type N-terminal cleavage/methylation domain-containing protein
MNTAISRRPRAFTLLEVMIAIGIFTMIIMAIYATWMSIVKGSRAAQNAAAAVQRSRIAMDALEASFRSMQLFESNRTNYLFIADTSGDFASVSMVTRLSPAIPGFGVHRGLGVSRVTFSPQPNEDGSIDLVMTHAPILVDTNNPLTPAYSAVLARDVTSFMVQFFDRQQQQYVDEWLYTNQLPPKVVVSLTTGTGKKTAGSRTPEDFVVREVTVASLGVPAALQGGRGMGPGGQPNPGGGQQPPPGGGQPPPDGRGPRDGRDNRGGRDARGGFPQNPNQFPRPNR